MGFSSSPGAIIRIGVDGAAESNREIDTVTRNMNNLASTVQNAMRNLAGAIGLGAGISGIVQLSDEYAKFTAQLKLATRSQSEYLVGYRDVKAIANAANQGLMETGVLYARIANGTRELGTSQKQVAAITETVNLALKVSGATASEAASAQLQLSQAFASGTLRGEEFNAVNEAAPRLMLALAEGMGMPVGALKAMAEEGKITSQIMAVALPTALEKLREEAKQVQTISGAFTVLKNNVMEFVGMQSQASGAVATFTSAIGFLSSNLALIAGAVATLTTAKLATWLTSMIGGSLAAASANRALAASNLAAAVTSTQAAAQASAAKLAEAQANVRATASAAALAAARVAELRASVLAAEGAVALAIATNGLIPAQARAIALAEANAVALSAQAVAAGNATKAAVASTGALAAQAAAGGLAARSMGLLRGAIAFLGGPIGAIITLLGIAVTAWSVWGQKAKESTAAVAESYEDAHKRIVKVLDEQITKNERLIQLKNLGMSKPAIDRDLPAIEQLAAASKRLNDINTRSGEFKGINNTEAYFAQAGVMNDIVVLSEKMKKNQDTTRAAEAMTIKERVSGLMKEHATKQEQMQAELKGIEDLKGKTAEYDVLVARIKLKYADKGGAAAAKQEATAYQNLITSVQERIAAGSLELMGYDKMTEAQKMTVKLDAAIATGKSKLSGEHIKEARAQIAIVAAQDAQILSTKNVKDGVQELADERNSAYESAMSEVRANEDLVAQYGMTKLQIEQLTLARLEDQLAQRAALELDDKAVAQLERMIAAKKRNLVAVGKLDGLERGSDVAKAKELLDVMTAVDEVTKEAASSMAASFGRVGSAIGNLTTALTGYGRAQAAIAAQLATEKRDAKNDPVKLKAAETKASQAAATAQIRQYGDMASAAKGFFKENSTGYKVMQGAEKAFRAYEMAMALQSMVKKIFFKESEVAANVALNGTKLAGEATTTAASTGLAATEASAWGITAVVKALASLPFPANLAAGAATLAAVVAIGAKMLGGIGGGSVSLSEQRQATQGTGSVLGDPNAKSESLSRSLELLSANSSIELNYTRGMLSALRNIETSMGGLSNLLFQGGKLSTSIPEQDLGSTNKIIGKVLNAVGGGVIGVLFDKLLGGKISKGLAKVSNAVFGGKVTTLDTGITADKASLGSIMSGGIRSNQYVDTKKDGGLFHSDKNRTSLTGLGAEANQQITQIIADMSEGIKQGAGVLGVGGDLFNQRLSTFVVDIGKISLKGLSAEQVQKELAAVFSKVGDDMARFGVAGLSQFQQVGEGYFQTLIRIASNYANLDGTLQSIGMTFGATGLASIAAREDLISMAGGISDLAGKASSFADNFLTEGERLAPVVKYVTDQMAAMGLAHIDTREKFKDHVLSLNLVNEAERQQFSALMDLEAAFAKTHATTEDLTMSEQAIADQRKSLQDQLDELTMTSAQLRAKERATIDASNLALFDQVVRQRDLKEATEKANDALKSTIERLGATKASTLAYRDSLLLGSLSTLTPMQKYLETQRQYSEALTKANAAPADAAAQSAVQSAATAFLSASQVINASSAAYINDKSKILGDMTTLATIAGAQMTDAQLQLSRLDAQVNGISTLNTTALAIEQAILNQGAVAPVFDAQRYGAGSSAGVDTLAGALRELRAENAETLKVQAELLAELKRLRADAARHATDAMGVAEEVGGEIADSITSAFDQAAYAAKKPTRVPTR
jgi:tape measure domain-containing protein